MTAHAPIGFPQRYSADVQAGIEASKPENLCSGGPLCTVTKDTE
jgi:hypothetical protein